MSFIKKLSDFFNNNKSVPEDEQLMKQEARDLAPKEPEDLMVAEDNDNKQSDLSDLSNKDSP